MIMKKTEQEQIQAILVQAIANICRKGLTYKRNFKIEGLLAITLDDEDIFLLNVKETVHNASYLLSSVNSKRQWSPAGTFIPIPRLSLVAKHNDSTPAVEDALEKEVLPELRTRKRRSSSGVSEVKSPVKKIDTDEAPEELTIKSEVDSAGEEHMVVTTNGTEDHRKKRKSEGSSFSVKPVKKRTVYGRSRKTKPRKSVPVRALPTDSSQPVFPEQDAPDLGHFLSMKPMLRDIDEADPSGSPENKDEESNQSAPSLQIDTGSNDEDRISDDGKSKSAVEQPEVYIDHCADGELSEVLNLTADSEVDTSYGSTVGIVFNDTEGYQCGLCDALFEDQIACRRHMRHQHKAKVSYTCELCGRRFWHHGDYNEHKAVFHEGPGGYPCEHCGKVLLSKRGLKEHTQHHTGKFPFFCNHCNRGFGRKFEYNIHMRKHHPEDIEQTESR